MNFDQLKAWWGQASTRDQLAIAALSFCLALYILYAAVLKSAWDMRDKQVDSANSQLAALERVRNLAAQWVNRGGSRSGSSGGGSLVEIVDNSLRQNKLRLNNMQPSGSNAVRLRLEAVEFNSLLAWLNQMETQQQLNIKEISIAGSKDAGMVSANLRLQRN
ncbi:MAG: type II secretion system protein M [Cellvibrionaceae bacterium]|nr:type II secretion system protein M [Cellvibrionaceae bacterium]